MASVQTTVGVTYETVVITSDPTYTNEAVEVYYRQEGPAAKRNFGVARSRGKYLIFLDDDVEVSPYCLHEFVTGMEAHPRCGMVFGKIYKMSEGRRNEFDAAGSWLTWTGFLWDRAGNHQVDTGQYDTPVRCLAAKSATCAIRSDLFRAVGGFDSDYYILGEETDLAYRVWLSGKEVWYLPSAVSWHAFGCEDLKPKADYYTLARIHRSGCRNYLSVLFTNLGLRRLWRIFPIHVCAWAVAACGFLVAGEWVRGVEIMRGMWEFCQRLPVLWSKRRRVQATRIKTDEELWPMISYQPTWRYYVHRLRRYVTQGLHG